MLVSAAQLSRCEERYGDGRRPSGDQLTCSDEPGSADVHRVKAEAGRLPRRRRGDRHHTMATSPMTSRAMSEATKLISCGAQAS